MFWHPGKPQAESLPRGDQTLWVPVTVSHGLICGFAATGA